MMHLDLQIDKLVLHHMPDGDHPAILAAIEAALTRLFSERGVPPALSSQDHMRHIDGCVLRLASGSTPDAIGMQVAQTIYHSVTGETGANQPSTEPGRD